MWYQESICPLRDILGDSNSSAKHPVIILAGIWEFSSHHYLGPVESTTKQLKISQQCFGPTKRVK